MYDSIYEVLWKRQNYNNRKQISDYQVEIGDWLQTDLRELSEVVEMCTLIIVVVMLGFRE